jgi:hypothetical protein
MRAALLLPPALIGLAAILLLGGWIVDDAGISYAYARSLALGHGLVAGPGQPAVEGYSNFLWVLLLALPRRIGLFDPVVIPKALGIGLVLWALVIVQRTFERHTGRRAPGAFAALWIAAAPPIAIWTVSGLENGLLLLLVVALWACATNRGRGWQARCGLLGALAAVTRPDGLQYLGFAMVAVLHDGLRGATGGTGAPRGSGGNGIAGAARALAGCLAGFLVVFGPFFALRMIVFDRPWPQTYYAKRAHPSLGAEIADLARHPGTVVSRVAEVGRALAGEPGPWILAATLVALAALASRRRLPRHVAVAGWLLAIALAGYVLMDPDWMGEYRFATGAITALAIAAAGLLFSVAEAPAARRRVVGAVAAAASLVILAGACPRVLRFAVHPTTPYHDVRLRLAERFAGLAERLDVRDASILTQDVGAVLDAGRLRVHDVTGLIEPEATRTLRNAAAGWRPDHPEFYDWVFDRIRPTFISTRGFWSVIPTFEYDPRFARDYAAIDSYLDLEALEGFKLALHSGDYVRRDALRDAGDLERLRAGPPPAPRRPTPAWRLVDAWRGVFRGAPTPAARHQEASRAEAGSRDPDRAAALYASLLERDPEDDAARLGLARSLDRAGRGSEARRAWVRIKDLESAKGTAADSAFLAEVADRLGDGRPRLPLTSLATAQWMRVGQRELDRDADTAVRTFREVLAVAPAHEEAARQLAKALTLASRSAPAALVGEPSAGARR